MLRSVLCSSWRAVSSIYGEHHLVLLSKRISSLIVSMIDSVLKFLPRWGMSPLTLDFEKVLFPFQASAQVAGPRRSSNEAQHKHIYKVLCHPHMKGKVAWVAEKFSSFYLSRYPSCYTINASFIISCAPSFINLGMRFLLSWEGCTTLCYRILNFLH
jgi:hypothetical protein